MSHPDPSRQAAVARPVLVTVTTLRTDTEDGCRQASAEGPFESALREALSQRLAPWAAEQVIAAVLARRPPAGQPVEYEDSFSPTRELHVAVRPAGPVDHSMKPKRRRLPGLFIPDAVRAGTGARPPRKVVST